MERKVQAYNPEMPEPRWHFLPIRVSEVTENAPYDGHTLDTNLERFVINLGCCRPGNQE